MRIEDLSTGYDRQVVAEHITFEVHKGDYLCIVGENGAGKSTLMKTILGLIPPIAGSITYEESEKSGIGYIPQQTDIQKDFPATVKEIVLSGTLAGMGHRPFYSKAEKAKAKEAIEMMDIWGLRDASFRNLSGGQKQRVLLARALCATREIMLLDEPVAGLDPKVTEDLYRLIREINDSGVTVIMISHDIEAALTYADHILFLGKKGSFFGTVEEYKNSRYAESFSAGDGREAGA